MFAINIVKALNNNLVLAKDSHGQELVLFGTGIGFKKKNGDWVEEENISKVFRPEDSTRFQHEFHELPPQYLDVSAKIIKEAETALDKKFGIGLLMALADHIQFAVKRGIVNDNPVKYEVPHLYRQEYLVGLDALKFIMQDLQVALDKEEASFIALHLVNAQIDSPNDMSETLQVTALIKEIIKIIQSIFNQSLDKNSIDYSRFVMHLRYFIVRQKQQQPLAKMDADLRTIIQERYTKSYACGLVIKEMMEREFKLKMSEDELIYLVIHIQRITTK